MRVPSCRFKSCYPHQAQNKSRESRLVLCFSKDSWDLKRRRNEWTSSGRPERRPTKRRSARIKSCYPHQAQNKSRESRLVLCFSKDSWDLKRRRNEWTSSGRPERRPTKRRSARIKSCYPHQKKALAHASAFFSDIRLRRTLLLRSDIRLRRVICASRVFFGRIIISLRRSRNITFRTAGNITFA